MKNILLIDENGNNIKAKFLFTHFEEKFNRNYIVYIIDNDLLASSYEKKDEKYLINNDLSSEELDLITKNSDQIKFKFRLLELFSHY